MQQTRRLHLSRIHSFVLVVVSGAGFGFQPLAFSLQPSVLSPIVAQLSTRKNAM
jgi:hypothetical protein